jgi:hypothetical protein
MSESSAYPLLVFAISLAAQWLAAFVGSFLRRRISPLGTAGHRDIDIILGATVTLLALIIGFSFSMAVTRYDQRNNYEEAEANAVGTAFLRADLLPGDDAARLRDLLKKYLILRIAFYETDEPHQIAKITADTANMQNKLWQAVLPAANAHPTPITSLAVAGINDLLNAQGYTQAAWLNRLPAGVWAIMGLIALATNLLIGVSERRKGVLPLLILPLIISTSFLLIADIESPRGGLIHVLPHNLIALTHALGGAP